MYPKNVKQEHQWNGMEWNRMEWNGMEEVSFLVKPVVLKDSNNYLWFSLHCPGTIQTDTLALLSPTLTATASRGLPTQLLAVS